MLAHPWDLHRFLSPFFIFSSPTPGHPPPRACAPPSAPRCPPAPPFLPRRRLHLCDFASTSAPPPSPATSSIPWMPHGGGGGKGGRGAVGTAEVEPDVVAADPRGREVGVTDRPPNVLPSPDARWR
jgi:hypothetical protein